MFWDSVILIQLIGVASNWNNIWVFIVVGQTKNIPAREAPAMTQIAGAHHIPITVVAMIDKVLTIVESGFKFFEMIIAVGIINAC